MKGTNILIDVDHRARLADFGLTSLTSDTATGSTGATADAGTARWMAPERFDSSIPAPPTHAADVYAFGYLCLTVNSPLLFRNFDHNSNICPSVVYAPAAFCRPS
jgi:serine/threonine protein kinase